MASHRCSWSNLPQELLPMISNCLLGYPGDVCRFRSVCSSWRSSTPPLKMSLPFPDVLPDKCEKYSHLNQVIIYRVEPVTTASSSSSRTPWVIAVEFVGDKLYFVDPLKCVRIDPEQRSMLPTELNLSDFQIMELQKVYCSELPMAGCNMLMRNEVFFYRDKTTKAVFISSNHYDETILATLNPRGKLAFYKLENNQWIALEKKLHMQFADIILYQGRLWGIDNNGITMVFNSSLEATIIAPCMLHLFDNHYKFTLYFVESRGHIFLVQRLWIPDDYGGVQKWIESRVYKMHVPANKWNWLKHLDDRVFFISGIAPWSLFWLPSPNENCVVIDCPGLMDDPLCNWDMMKFGELLEDSRQFSKLFWPPPNWFGAGNTSN